MTIMLGMNDASYRAFDEQILNQYRTGYEHIVETVTAALPQLRLTLIQPSPFDDVTQPPRFEGGYNSVLLRYSQFVKELAEREHATVADLNRPVVAALEKARDGQSRAGGQDHPRSSASGTGGTSSNGSPIVEGVERAQPGHFGRNRRVRKEARRGEIDPGFRH